MNSITRKDEQKAVSLESLTPTGAVEAVAWVEDQSRPSHRRKVQEMLGALKRKAVNVDFSGCGEDSGIWG